MDKKCGNCMWSRYVHDGCGHPLPLWVERADPDIHDMHEYDAESTGCECWAPWKDE